MGLTVRKRYYLQQDIVVTKKPFTKYLPEEKNGTFKVSVRLNYGWIIKPELWSPTLSKAGESAVEVALQRFNSEFQDELSGMFPEKSD